MSNTPASLNTPIVALLSISVFVYEVYSIKGVGEGGGGGHEPPHFQKWGAQVGLCPPLLGRANVLISLFAHILWLKTHFFFKIFSLRSPILINEYFLNFANLKL